MFTTQIEDCPAPGCAIPWATTERSDRKPDFPKKENTSLIFAEIAGWASPFLALHFAFLRGRVSQQFAHGENTLAAETGKSGKTIQVV